MRAPTDAIQRLGAVLLSALALTGCGWHHGLSVPPEIDSLAIEVVRNDTLERDLEARFNEALSSVTVDLVDRPLVRPRDADAVLRSRITSFRRRRGVQSADNRWVETAVRIRVEAELIRRRSGEAVRHAEASIWSGFGLDERENEEPAVDRALRYLAEELVLELFLPVDYEDGEDGVTADRLD